MSMKSVMAAAWVAAALAFAPAPALAAFDADPLEAHEAHLTFHRGIWTASENTLLIRLWPVIESQAECAGKVKRHFEAP